jgi:hypothetical protein
MYYILSTFTYHLQSCWESRNCSNVVDVEKTFETGAARLGYGDVSVKSEVGHQGATAETIEPYVLVFADPSMRNAQIGASPSPGYPGTLVSGSIL